MNNINDTLIPKIGVITDVRIDTPDIKTFRVVTTDGKKAFDHRPGQCAMLSVPGVGEAMFSITSSPTNEEYMEFSIKKCGCVTDWLHQAEVGQQITIRGPYGNPFPVDDVFAGKNLLFIAGGVGLAPLRSVINYCRHYRDRYGDIDIVYGSRSKADLLDSGDNRRVGNRCGCKRASDYRQSPARLGRTRWFRSQLRKGAWLRYQQDRSSLRPPHYDKVHP